MSAFSRTIAISALAAATILGSPFAANAAGSVTSSPSATPPAPMAAAAPASQDAPQHAPRETVEQRIATLHTSLNITPSEEADWNGVSKAMRDSAAVMEKLAAEKSATDPASMTALDDLKTYEKFAQAHTMGLKKLTSSFAKLYKSMPDAQKKVADAVFQNFGHDKTASHS